MKLPVKVSLACGIALVCGAVFWGSLATASPTAKWTVDGYENWDKGEAEQAFITSTGEVRAGWTTSHKDLEIGGTWAAVAGPGDELFVGTDDEATVYRIVGDKATKLASIEDAVAVVSLVLGPKGILYAGTMPAGQIWSIDSKSGAAKKVATLKGAETVWSMALDGRGNLFAGTGPDGVLFRVDLKSGKATEVFRTGDRRILSMIATSDGAIWFGTSDDAIVFRHDPGRAITRAIADFPGNEITALVEQNGKVIAAANDLKEPTTSGVKSSEAVKAGAKKKPTTKKTTAVKKPGDEVKPKGIEPPRSGARKGKGSLFRVSGDGQFEEVHSLKATYFTALAANDAGDVFAGAGDKGRIFLIGSGDSVSTAFDVSQRQIAQIIAGPGDSLRFLTGDSTALYRTTGRANTAKYMSEVFDADATARFGSIEWRSSGDVRVETRTGNTEEPGAGWSKWQPVRDAYAAGGGGKRAKVVSPPGRYLQFRGNLRADGALQAARVFYLSQNRPTRVDTIEVKAKGVDAKAILKSNGGTPRNPTLELKWTVDNEDKDPTHYRLDVRREGDVLWRSVTTGREPLSAAKYDWNTETYPDGYYRLRVMASDSPANPAGRATETSKISSVFALDNQRPTISQVNVRYPSVSARATDALSPLSAMSWSLDDGRWHVGDARDGMFDDTTELLSIRLPSDLDPGAHTLSIRVVDEAGNIGSVSVSFRRN